MEKIAPDLWQTTLHSGLPNSYAYFLERKKGNILFYNTNNADDLNQIENLGGIKYQLLTHRDEAGSSLQRIKERFNTILACSELEVPAVSRYTSVDLPLKPENQQLEDISIIETPGHTNGSLCFFYQSPYGECYLFTGDTLFQSHGEWSTFVIHGFGGSEASLANSLGKIRDLKPDLVMSSGFIGEIGMRKINNETEWTQAIDENIQKLEKK